MRKTAHSWLIFVVLFAAVGACDSGDPENEAHPRDVAGQYEFEEFTFDPDGQAFQPIVVLDTLVQSETGLSLSSGGDFVLSFQFVNGDVFFPSGDFDVSMTSVRLNGNDNAVDQLERLLLRDEITLRRSEVEPGVLTAEIPMNINPSLFSERYAGVTQMSGTLRLRLVME